MCLLTKQKIAYKAKKDISVYKVLDQSNESLWSPCRNFEYKLGELNKTNMIVDFGVLFDSQAITEAHEYDCFWDITKKSKFSKIIGPGFHSAFQLTRLEAFFKSCSKCPSIIGRKSVIVKCIIPAGSLYYKDIKGSLIVSNQIIIDSIVES